MALATQLGNDKVLVRLLRLVDVVGDPSGGVVRVKEKPLAGDLLSAAVGSVVSSMSPDGSSPRTPERTPSATRASGPDVVCAECHRTWPPGSVFCGGCGQRMDAP